MTPSTNARTKFPRSGGNPLHPRSFQFTSSQKKAEGFMKWLQEQSDQGLLGMSHGESKPSSDVRWSDLYISSPYRKGIVDGFIDAKKAKGKDLNVPMPFGAVAKGGKLTGAEFIKSAFNHPIHADRVALLYTRAFDGLKGITSDMSMRISRSLAQGLVDGKNPRQLASELTDQVDISLNRARVLARTETIRAHAEGSLNTYEQLGIEEVEAEVEFFATRDARTCPICRELSGKIYKVADSHGIIPKHPQCRCRWLSYIRDEVESTGKFPKDIPYEPGRVGASGYRRKGAPRPTKRKKAAPPVEVPGRVPTGPFVETRKAGFQQLVTDLVRSGASQEEILSQLKNLYAGDNITDDAYIRRRAALLTAEAKRQIRRGGGTTPQPVAPPPGPSPVSPAPPTPPPPVRGGRGGVQDSMTEWVREGMDDDRMLEMLRQKYKEQGVSDEGFIRKRFVLMRAEAKRRIKREGGAVAQPPVSPVAPSPVVPPRPVAPVVGPAQPVTKEDEQRERESAKEIVRKAMKSSSDPAAVRSLWAPASDDKNVEKVGGRAHRINLVLAQRKDMNLRDMQKEGVLVTTQKDLAENVIVERMKNIKLVGTPGGDDPMIVKSGGKYYVVSNGETVAARLLGGVDSGPVMYYDADLHGLPSKYSSGKEVRNAIDDLNAGVAEAGKIARAAKKKLVNELMAGWKEKYKENKEFRASLKFLSPDSPEYKALQDRIGKNSIEMDRISNEQNQLARTPTAKISRSPEELRALLFEEDADQAKWSVQNFKFENVSADHQRRITGALDDVRKMINRAAIHNNPDVTRDSPLGQQDAVHRWRRNTAERLKVEKMPERGSVLGDYLSGHMRLRSDIKSNLESVAAHEFGHHLQNVVAPNWQRPLNDFFKQRTKGEAVHRLPGHSEGVVGKEDKFKWVYMGRTYEGFPRELLSVGLEEIYKNPANVAKKDPGFFDLIMGILKGF